MEKLLAYLSSSPAMAVIGIITGVLGFGLLSGTFTGSASDQIELAKQQGYTAGYTSAQAEAPAMEVQESVIHIISSAVFMENMEVELKGIARSTNAIEFTYGEKGGERERVAALHPGDAIARRFGNNLYVIKSVSVAANLQYATIEVTRIGF